MGRKSNDVESYKRKTKKDKARRKKELFGKYHPTKEGDTIASQSKNNISKKSQNHKKSKKEKKSKKNFSKSSQNKKTKK